MNRLVIITLGLLVSVPSLAAGGGHFSAPAAARAPVSHQTFTAPVTRSAGIIRPNDFAPAPIAIQAPREPAAKPSGE
jgi:hypothetical protein